MLDMQMASLMDWANIPAHILDTISHKLIARSSEDADSRAHYIRFGAVCKAWRQISVHNFTKYPILINIRRPHLLPYLMVPTTMDRASLLNVAITNPHQNQVLTASASVQVPYYIGSCCGSSHGWLAFSREYKPLSYSSSLSITLYNPFTEKTIDLPRIDNRTSTYVDKVILSSDPTTNHPAADFIVLVLLKKRRGSSLAMLRSGDTSWTDCFESPFPIYEYGDVLFHKGRVYLADASFNRIQWFDYCNPARVEMTTTFSMSNVRSSGVQGIEHQGDVGYEKLYLVESTDGCLYKVLKYLDVLFFMKNDCPKARFEVHKLMTTNEEGQAEWKRVDDIGGNTFFLGSTNHSMAVKASDHVSCVPDSIYFIPNTRGYGKSDVWIFELKQQQQQRNFGFRYHIFESSIYFMPPAIWIEPTGVSSDF